MKKESMTKKARRKRILMAVIAGAIALIFLIEASWVIIALLLGR